MHEEGWVKLHRRMLSSTLFKNEKLLKFWIWCLLSATHKEHTQRVGLQEIVLLSGQFVFGRKEAAKELNLTEGTTYKYLKMLENENRLELNSNNKFTVVTIIKWEFYQDDTVSKEQQNNNKGTTKEQQSNTNKNVKNDKNVKNNIKTYACEFEIFWSAYPRKKDKGNACKKYNARLESGFSEAQLLEAAEKYAKECKNNNTEEKYIKHAATFLGDATPFIDYLDANYVPSEDGAKGSKTKFSNFEAHKYDFDKLESELLG